MNKKLLSLVNFFIKGMEVSLLLVAALAQKDLGISIIEVGLLGMIFVIAQVSISPLSGFIANRIGSKAAVLASLAFYAIAWAIFLLHPPFGLLAVCYILGGVGSGLFEPLGNALVARESKSESRGKEIGNYGASGDLGRIITSSFAATLFALFGWQQLSLTFAVLTIGLFVFGLRLTRFASQPVAIVTTKQYAKELVVLSHNKKFGLANIAGILDSFSGASLYIFIPFLLLSKGLSLVEIGFFVSPLYFSGYLFGRLILGRLTDQIGGAKTLIIAEVLMAVCICVFIQVQDTIQIAAVLVLLGLVTRGTSPVIKTLIADSLPTTEDYEKGFGVYSFFAKLASIVSRPLFGVVGSSFGVGSVFYLAGAMALTTIIPSFVLLREKAKKA